MKTYLVFAMLLLGTTLSAQGWGWGIKGEGPVVRKKIKLESLDGIQLSISCNVYLSQGEHQSIEVEGQENIIENLSHKVESGKWTIRFKENVRGFEKLNIYITMPHLKHIGVSGSGDVIGKTRFTTDDLRVAVSGSGDIRLELTGTEVEAAISGSGDIALSGKCNQLEISMSGSGDVTAGNLMARDVKVAISGSGDVEVHATENLQATISGSGEITYSGNPSVKSRISGSGDVTRKHD